MEDFDRKYLESLIRDTEKKQKRFRYSPPDETDAAVSYISSKLKVHWAGSLGALHFRQELEKYSLNEKPRLRTNTQNYFRIVRKEGRLIRIDSFVHGRLDVILLMHYEDNRRYAFPFSRTGGFYPTYTQVQVYDDDGAVTEDYMVRSGQLVYHEYRKHSPDTVLHRMVYYTPGSSDPTFYKEEGIYTLGETLTYMETYNWAWSQQVPGNP